VAKASGAAADDAGVRAPALGQLLTHQLMQIGASCAVVECATDSVMLAALSAVSDILTNPDCLQL
jgi:hypothetical protein